MVRAQAWLDKNYPTKNRKKIRELDVSNKDLEGILDLTDFINLRKLDCSENRLTYLKLSGLGCLEKVECTENCLTDFDYISLNPTELTFLNISDNNLPEQDLSVFNRFTGLEFLWIGNSYEAKKITEQKYNRFHGSLKSLQNNSELESLHISNTDINLGLEHLSTENLKMFLCGSEREGAKVEEIRKKLDLDEKVAESEGELENNYKIRKIKHFQLGYDAIHKKRIFWKEISQVRHALKTTYLLAIINIPNEVFSKVSRGEIYPSSSSIKSEISEKLRRIGQEIVISDREENGELTWKKINSICNLWVRSELVWLPFQMIQQEEIQKKIIGKNSEENIKNALKNLFLETGGEVRNFKEIKNSEKIFSFEVNPAPILNLPEYLVLAQLCQCFFNDITEALPYHIEYHLANVRDVIEFEEELVQLINRFKKDVIMSKNHEKEQQGEAQIQVAFPHTKKI